MDAALLRRMVLGVSVALAVICVTAVLLRQPEPPQALEPDLAALPPVETELPVEIELPPWRLGIWQGRVAVFEEDDTQPIRVLDTPVVSLPDPDQLSLEQGIPVYSQEDLAYLLEDYGS